MMNQHDDEMINNKIIEPYINRAAQKIQRRNW